jgi:ribokinase
MPRSSDTIDFLAIGDTMLDVFVQIEEAGIKCTIDRSACTISFPFGEKIPVQSVIKIPGAGNASNVTIAMQKLGRKTAIYSVLGDDPEGKTILEHWKQLGIQTRYVKKADHQETNYSTVLNFKGERTILVYHHPYVYQLPAKLPPVKRMYYTSVNKEHLTLEKELLTFLKAHPKTLVTFQPGTHQLRRLARGTHEILEKTEILIMNKEEAALFLETSVSDPIKTQLKRLRALGPRICVITDGEHGSYAIDDTKAWSCISFPIASIERTGAGDSYASAFTWAIDKGFSVPEAMRYGTANSCGVIQYLGPHAGLLNREDLERMLRKYKSIRPKALSL